MKDAISRRDCMRLLGTGILAGCLSGCAVVPRLPPATRSSDKRSAMQRALDDLVAANRILTHEQVIDAFGHVSVRHPERTGHFLMSRARAPALVDASDIMAFDADGVAISPAGRHPYSERFIHAAIYAARPDVQSVIHHHSAETIPFGISGAPLGAVSHVGGIIGQRVRVWDIADTAGSGSNMLVTDMAKILSDETPGDAVNRTWEFWCLRAGVPYFPEGA